MNATLRTNGDRRESSDGYRGEIIRSGRWRVIEGTCRRQWVLQRLTRAWSPDGGRWEGEHYCQTREALLRLWTASTGEDGALLVALLPERFRLTQATINRKEV